MAAIKGVAKASVVKKSKEENSVGVIALVIAIVASILVTSTAFILIWQFKVKDEYAEEIRSSVVEGMAEVVVVTRDLNSGESLEGNIKTVSIPTYMLTNNMLSPQSVDVYNSEISRFIPNNSILTSNDIYDPDLEDVVLNSSRWVLIDFLPIYGVSEGQFIDIRIKSNNIRGDRGVVDEIVISKKLIRQLSPDGRSMQLVLSEAEIQNLNSAVVEAATDVNQAYQLYMTTYVDPANQSKAKVTYIGKGIAYSEKELDEARAQLKNSIVEQPVSETTTEDISDTTEETTDTNPNDAGNIGSGGN